MLSININGLWVSRCMAKGLHGQIGRETEAGQVFKLIPGHGPRGVLRSHGGHARLTIGTGTNTVHTAGAPHHFLCECKPLATVCGLLRLSEELALTQSESLACFGGEASADNQVDTTAGLNLIKKDI